MSENETTETDLPEGWYYVCWDWKDAPPNAELARAEERYAHQSRVLSRCDGEELGVLFSDEPVEDPDAFLEERFEALYDEDLETDLHVGYQD